MTPRKQEANGLIATPPTYYSTTKARYLATKYKDNLDRLVERITRNPKTAPLQFANNISSVGGIGFFTHSATKTADERYLEVVLATPETFEIKGEFSEKVQRLISRYGIELLGIVSGDNEIYQDREMSGYGLNLAWRNVVKQGAGNRVTLERAIIYFPKERVRKLLQQGGSPNDLLADAVIFAVEEDGPLNLVSYRPQVPNPDVRAAIQEDNLASAVSPRQALGTGASSTVGEKSVQTPQPEQFALNPNNESLGPVGSPGETKPVRGPTPIQLPIAEASSMGKAQAGEANSAANSAQPATGSVADVPLAPAPAAGAKPVSEKSVGSLAALKNRPAEVVEDKPAAARPATKPLEGFIVQLAFNDKEKAQQWAEKMARRGFVVSLTEAGAEGSLRVRLGNFTARDDAERQLRTFKQEGLHGIVINLPQAFRPVARTSVP
jgi:cell division protein FtsN